MHNKRVHTWAHIGFRHVEKNRDFEGKSERESKEGKGGGKGGGVCVRDRKCVQSCDHSRLPHDAETHQSWLLMASPYPGVSTTVRRSLTPLSSISTVDASICTVLSIFSVRWKYKKLWGWSRVTYTTSHIRRGTDILNILHFCGCIPAAPGT